MKGGNANGRMHGGYSYSSSSRRWGNVYVVMVMVFSVFVCGVLGLHTLTERRHFSLLNKQKDDQILSLHLLLQKERDRLQEFKKKTEEMKMEIMSLGSQKADLNSKISDMQSTISSLREEQKAVETAFQEKQNEVRMMKVKEPDPQVEALMEDLRRREAEIGDLKHRLQLRGAEVQPSNATATESEMTGREEIDRSSENGGSEEKIGEEGERREKKEYEDDGESGHNQELDVHGGKMKMEVQENTHRVRKRAYLRRVKGKRWRSIAKLTQGRRVSPSNAASTMANQTTSSVETYSEERPPGNEGLSRNDLRNSSSEGARDSLEELAKKPEIKMENRESENRNAVQHIEENKQINVKLTEGSNEQQHTNLLGRKGGKPDAVRRGYPEESDVGEDSQEKEETDEQEF